MTELLLGCGFSRQNLLGLPGAPLEFQDLITLDKNEKCNPDLLCNLDEMSDWLCVPVSEHGSECLFNRHGMGSGGNGFIKRDYFDEVHAYEVLEHLGTQGDAASFFATFNNIHRVLKPGGHLFGTCPSRHSPWAWGDPSHRRIISQESLIFLSQEKITMNRKRGTQMSDFSDIWNKDFKIIASSDDHVYHKFCLQAV